MIETEGLGRRFGDVWAVQGISLQVRPGEIFGVLGPNGAGKSTTIRMLCGILKPSAGQGRVAGFDILQDAERIKERIGYMTQRFSLYEDLSVQENLRFYASIYGLGGSARRARVQEVLAQTGLEPRRRQLAGTLSGGWKQRVALACATIHNPPLLFLDEPTAGVDPVSRREFWERIHDVAHAGTTVLLTTHYMDEAARCHRLAFVFRGRLLAVETPAAIVAARAPQIVEFEVEGHSGWLQALEQAQGVEAVEHLGSLVRVATRGLEDPLAAVRRILARHAQGPIPPLRAGHATVEDAFVAMVRDHQRAAAEEGP